MRWWDGLQWTEFWGPASLPANAPTPPNAPLPPNRQAPPPRPLGPAFPRGKVLAAAAAALVVVVVVVIVSVSGSRDAESYQAGKEAGERFARTYTQLSSDSRSDDQLHEVCVELVPSDTSDDFHDFDRDDFVDGCYEATRAAIAG